MVLFYLGLLLTVGSWAQDKKAYVFFDKNGRRTSYKKLLRKSEKADIVLFGEYHNNPIAHWLELELLKDLQPKRPLVLGAEMLERDNQEALDRYLQGAIDQKGLDTLACLWKNYKTDYKPLVDFAKKHQLPFVATNIPRQYANLVYKKGIQALDTLTSTEKQWIVRLPFAYDGSLSQYEKMKKMSGHNTENLPSDYYQGIGWYLRRERPNLRILTIATTSQAALKKLEKESYEQADFILVVDEDLSY